MKLRIKSLLFLNLYYVVLIIFVMALGVIIRIPWAVSAFGIIEALDRSFVKPKIEGTISEILVEEGQYVKKGQLLARLRDSDSEIHKVTYLAALELAKNKYEQAKAMFSKGFISYNEFLQIKKDYEIKLVTVKEMNDYNIVASMDGTVLAVDELKLRIGDNVPAGSIIATIAHLDNMVLKLSVPDHLISKVQEDQEVRCYIVAFPSTTYGTIKGKVKKILPQAIVSDKGISFVVLVSMEKPYTEKGGKKIFLKPGMSAHAKIIYETTSFFEHIIFRGFDIFYRKAKFP